MEKLLYEYLILYKQICLPFIGKINIKHIPAYYDKENMELKPGTYYLDFDTNISNQNSYENLYLYLKNKFYGDELNSKNKFFEFIKSISYSIKSGNFIWNNVGLFTLSKDNKVVFESKFNDNLTLYKNTFKAKNIKPITFVEKAKKIPLEKNNVVNNNTNIKNISLIQNENITSKEKNELNNNDSNNNHNTYLQLHNPNKFIFPEIPKENIRHLPNIQYTKIKTEFLDTDLAEKYNTFQKVFIITVLVITILYLFFHLFLNDFSFHSYSN